MNGLTRQQAARFDELFSDFVAPEFTDTRRPLFNERTGTVEVAVKTMFAGMVDAWGSARPTPDAMERAKGLAQLFGMRVQWHEIEKGWGDLVFTPK